MSRRELWRRIAIWGYVAAYFGVAVWLATYGATPAVSLIGFFGWALVGGFILTERPGNGVGRFMLAMAGLSALLGLSLATELVATWPLWFELLSWIVGGPFWFLIPGIALLFPTGRLETRFSRAVAWLFVAVAAIAMAISAVEEGALNNASGRPNPLAVPALQPIVDAWVDVAQFGVIFALFGLMITDLVLRWRKAAGPERLQFRWLVFGVGGMVLLIAGLGPVLATFPQFSDSPIAIGLVSLCLNLPAVAIGIAVTRHGLYSIGRVLSRTVTYLISLGLAIGVYAGLVIGLTALIPGLPSIGVALATLAAAAVFLPVLRWVQRRLDRAFDRERYNAEQVVEAFGTRLRSEVDPETTVPDLTRAVERTLRPNAIGVWTR